MKPICLDDEQASRPFRPSQCPDGDLACIRIIRSPDDTTKVELDLIDGHIFDEPNEDNNEGHDELNVMDEPSEDDGEDHDELDIMDEPAK